ncbi:hypothetical protein [Paenibacillus sp. Leaf72]|uniref:hypothetical protein n=1 Tax=Paenibacillus sp. Leaf72 TaxID=1736234 RepID=UPI0006F54DEB|nr:hypothetical protein [Paenibacillus sp. Leaf72]KQO18415.1 hypothetical protein ASF12_07335 [Paenibacillus sp. Leaf72]
MSQMLDANARENGTRFLIYPQSKTIPGFEQPEVVYLNAQPGSIQSGPEDNRIYVVDAVNKIPFGFEGSPAFKYRYEGEQNPPVKPDADGHFDHIRPGTHEFSAMTMFATVRRVMEIWEDYFGHAIKWPFSPPKLLLIPRVEWDNAHSGLEGFLEFGFPRGRNGRIDHNDAYCENFDVLAHETGHTINFSVLKGLDEIQNSDQLTPEYGGHHEAFGDLVAIVATLHFDSVIKRLLDNTKGNLFSPNELTRLGELSGGRSIRIAFNDFKMSMVGREPHALSQPFTGGAFDILVEMFQLNLIEQGLISQSLGDRSFHAKGDEISKVQREFEALYPGKEEQFTKALLDARDTFGKLMATAWSNTEVQKFSYNKMLGHILDADRELYNGKYEKTIRGCFDWRGITASTRFQFDSMKTHLVDELLPV